MTIFWKMLILNIQKLRKMISAKTESLPTHSHYRSDKMYKISNLFENANMAYGNLPQNVIFEPGTYFGKP